MPKVTKKVKTAADFRAAHDPDVIVPNKIRSALAEMLREGKENWEYEGDFVRRAKIGMAQLTTFREQFAAHIVDAPAESSQRARRVWFADAKIAKKIREG